MVQVGNFKGSPTICLNPGARFLFRFGLSKAQLILENIDAIRAFVRQHGGGSGSGADRSDMEYEDRCAERAGFSAFGAPE